MYKVSKDLNVDEIVAFCTIGYENKEGVIVPSEMTGMQKVVKMVQEQGENVMMMIKSMEMYSIIMIVTIGFFCTCLVGYYCRTTVIKSTKKKV